MLTTVAQAQVSPFSNGRSTHSSRTQNNHPYLREAASRTKIRPNYQTGAPWPKFQASNLNNGQGLAGGSNGQYRWSYNSGDPTFYGSPVVAADGTVYTSGQLGTLTAISPNGAGIWSYRTGDGFAGAPAIGNDGTIYLVGANLGGVYAINPDGSLKWTLTISDALTGVSIGSDGTLYIAGHNGGLYSVSSAGALNWSYQTGDSFFSGCPAIASDGTIYLAGVNGFVYAFDSTGTNIWTYAAFAGDSFKGSVTISPNGTILAASVNAAVYAINPDGTDQWISFNSGGFDFGAPGIAPDGTIYVADGYSGKIFAINPDGSAKWEYDSGSAFFGSVSVGSDGTAYALSTSGIAFAVGTDGSLQWSYNTAGSHFYGAPAIGSDGTLYACGTTGIVFALGTQVNNISATGLDITPSSVAGGNTSTGTVTIGSNAPAGGDIVTLKSSDPSVIVPNFVTVPSGSNTATFTINTKIVGSATTGVVTATSGGSDVTASLTVQPPTISSLTLNPTTITGGVTTSTGTVTLTGNAPTGGLVVTLVNQWPTYVTVPASVTVPAGSNTATFSISSPQMWQIQFTDQITAQTGAVSQSATLTVATTALQSITVNPTSIHAGDSTTGTVTLGGPAPAGGWVITLISGSAYYVTMPATVTVPEGATSATFTVNSLKATPGMTVQLSAHDSVIWHSANLTVINNGISTLTVNPGSIAAGTSTTGTITLKSAAPTGGWSVNLSAGASSEVLLPASVVVPAGATTVNFTITTKVMSATLTSGIYATDNLTYKSTSLTVMGDLISGLSLSPTTIGGNGSTTATVTLSSPAPANGWNVNLTAGVPGAVSMPASVIVPAGATSTTFTILGKELSTTYTTGIYAGDGNSSKSATLTILGDGISSVSVNPSSITAGNNATGTVTLTGAAPIGGWLVKISVGVPGEITVPATVLVPAGSSSATFTVATKVMAGTLTSGLYATDGTTTRSTSVTVNGDAIASVSVSPSTVQGGTGATGTVTLSGPAPAGGWLVRLSAGAVGVVGVPASVVVPAGSTSVTFSVTTKAVATTLSSLIFASDGNTGQSTTLTVTH